MTEPLFGYSDRISFEIMWKRAIQEALTGDHYFAQAAFIPLLKTQRA